MLRDDHALIDLVHDTTLHHHEIREPKARPIYQDTNIIAQRKWIQTRLIQIDTTHR